MKNQAYADPTILAIAILAKLNEAENNTPGTLELVLHTSLDALRARWIAGYVPPRFKAAWELVTNSLYEAFERDQEQLYVLSILNRMVADRVLSRYEAAFAPSNNVCAAA